MIIHVGYKLLMTEEVKRELGPFLGRTLTEHLEQEPIVAILFRENIHNMESWYNSKSKLDEIYAYIRGVYKQDKYAVAHITIDGANEWIILHRGTNIKPLDLKKRVGKGELGNKIETHRIKVQAVPYMFRDEKIEFLKA